jgi:hypothetical protein
MAGTFHGRSFRLSPIDGRGRRIDPVVLDVAEDIAARAIRHAEKLLRDPALATSLLEESAATVSRAIRAKNQTGNAPVRKLHAYLFRAFVRHVNRVKRKHPTFVELAKANPATDFLATKRGIVRHREHDAVP